MLHWQKYLQHMPTCLGNAVSKHARTEKVRKMGQLLGYPMSAYFLSRQVFSPHQIKGLIAPPLVVDFISWSQPAFCELLTEAQNLDEIDQVTLFELRTYMLSTLLRDTDQMSMAHSLEVRVPLIDHVVVEKMLSVPGAWKKEPSVPKPVLIHAAGAGLPKACVDRPKQGFVFPFRTWFQGALKKDMESFGNGEASAIFDKKGLLNVWHQYQTGYVSWSRIWGLFVLNHWLMDFCQM